MEFSEDEKRAFVKRLLLSRVRILTRNGFYGLLLMQIRFGIDEQCDTAATDGERIVFGPQFLKELSDDELDFVMMHEILHVALQHCLRGQDADQQLFNIACDIVVNSNILLSNHGDLNTITLAKYGTAMHLAPDGKEGSEYTAEQVYRMLLKDHPAGGKGGKGGKSGKSGGKTGKAGEGDRWDDHGRWGTHADDALLKDEWTKRVRDACEACEAREAALGAGHLPAFAKRLLAELRHPQIDWRTILCDFVQEEVTDYSFTPPDRRHTGDFFLPDFNEKDDRVENILFMIDTSASMTDEMVTSAYSEIAGAIEQFGGRLSGMLGFFDAAVIPPVPFSDIEEFKLIRPVGGGGTSFAAVFDYIAQKMRENLPASIIILTDGYAAFPPERAALGIPVLWLLNNGSVTPPWGKIARIEI